MALTYVKVRNAKVKPKAYKLADSNGLFLPRLCRSDEEFWTEDYEARRIGRRAAQGGHMSNYPLRLPETLMDDARNMAKAQGVSVNQFLATVIAERVGELKALNHVRSRMAAADLTKARAVLALVPDRTPMEGDELLN